MVTMQDRKSSFIMKVLEKGCRQVSKHWALWASVSIFGIHLYDTSGKLSWSWTIIEYMKP